MQKLGGSLVKAEKTAESFEQRLEAIEVKIADITTQLATIFHHDGSSKLEDIDAKMTDVTDELTAKNIEYSSTLQDMNSSLAAIAKGLKLGGRDDGSTRLENVENELNKAHSRLEALEVRPSFSGILEGVLREQAQLRNYVYVFRKERMEAAIQPSEASELRGILSRLSYRLEALEKNPNRSLKNEVENIKRYIWPNQEEDSEYKSIQQQTEERLTELGIPYK